MAYIHYESLLKELNARKVPYNATINSLLRELAIDDEFVIAGKCETCRNFNPGSIQSEKYNYCELWQNICDPEGFCTFYEIDTNKYNWFWLGKEKK